MKRIFKYTLNPTGDACLEYPEDAQILSIQVQRGYVVMWVLVDPHAPSVAHFLRCRTTGESFDDAKEQYVGTFQLDDGSYVGHVFEVKR